MKFKSVLLVTILLLSLASLTQAQTVINPRIVEFTASPDHSTLRLDGTPALATYNFTAVGMNGNGAVVVNFDLGKPTPDSTGKISVPLPSSGLAMLSPNKLYTGAIFAIGPDGTSPASPQSNPFGNAAPIVPRAAGVPVVKP